MTDRAEQLEDRNMGLALWRGFLCRCPHCGKGKMFRGYLRVADQCDVCGEELSHHRADDFPPYITIVIVGHILIFAMLHAEISGPVDPLHYMMWVIPLSVIMPLVLLPPVKGAVVGMQWAARMYGFGTGQID